MTVLELMERTGLRSGQRAMAYVKDGLLDISRLMPERTKRYVFSIESGVRFYNLPSDFVSMRGVYQAFDSATNTKYIGIPRIQNIEILQDSSSTTGTSDDSLIVI